MFKLTNIILWVTYTWSILFGFHVSLKLSLKIRLYKTSGSRDDARTHAHPMFVNIAPRDLLIQQRRPVHPGKLYTRPSERYTLCCFKDGVSFPRKSKSLRVISNCCALRLCSVIVYIFMKVYETCLEKYRIFKKWFSSSFGAALIYYFKSY